MRIWLHRLMHSFQERWLCISSCDEEFGSKRRQKCHGPMIYRPSMAIHQDLLNQLEGTLDQRFGFVDTANMDPEVLADWIFKGDPVMQGQEKSMLQYLHR